VGGGVCNQPHIRKLNLFGVSGDHIGPPPVHGRPDRNILCVSDVFRDIRSGRPRRGCQTDDVGQEWGCPKSQFLLVCL